MSQFPNRNYASDETFPYFNPELVTPLQIGGLGVQLLNYYQGPIRGLKNSERQMPQGFTKKEYHRPPQEETPQEQGLEIGYVRDMELSR